ncbi:MAG: phosphotransferase [Acidimicrobiales bacterium]
MLDLDERPGAAAPAVADKVAVRLRSEHPLYDAMSLRRQFDDQVRLRGCGLPGARDALVRQRRPGARRGVLRHGVRRRRHPERPALVPRRRMGGGPARDGADGAGGDHRRPRRRLHTIDPDAAGFSFDSPTEPDALLASMLAARHQMLDRFAGPQDPSSIRTALSWLEARAPHLDGPLRLCWGDARLPNMAFVDAHVSAVLDWEDLHLAWPVFDLAWFIYMDAISAIQGGLEQQRNCPTPRPRSPDGATAPGSTPTVWRGPPSTTPWKRPPAAAAFSSFVEPPGGGSDVAQAADAAFVHGLAIVMGVGAVINLLGVVVARHFLPSGPIGSDAADAADTDADPALA